MTALRKKSGITVAALFLCAVAAYFFFDSGAEKSGSFFNEETRVLALSPQDRADVYAFKDRRFYLTTRDGLNFYTTENEVLWAHPYPVSLAEPVLTGGGRYAGVSDKDGAIFYFFSPDGICYTKRFDEKIYAFSVSSGGYAALIVKNGDDYAIPVFNAKGDEINCYFSRKENVFPTYAAVSPDGRVLALGVLDTGGGGMDSKLIMLYNRAGEKQMWVNGIFYEEVFTDALLTQIKFLTNDEYLLFTDNHLYINSIESGRKWEQTLENEVKSINFFANGLFALCFGEPFAGEDGETAGQISIYNAKGRVLTEFGFSQNARLFSCGDFLVAGSNFKYVAFDKRGKCVWQYNSPVELKKLLIASAQNTAVCVDNESVRLLKKH